MFKDYYKILESNSILSVDNIKRKFRLLAKKYHPDVNSNSDAKAKFIEIYEAYKILSNIELKNEYDKSWMKYHSHTSFSSNESFDIETSDIRKEAEKYSNMNYESFLQTSLFEIKFLVKKSGSIGANIMLYFLGYTFIASSFFALFIGDNSAIIMFFSGIIFGSMFIYVARHESKKLKREKEYMKNPSK
jgi:curved DNA-binding protein CbpA